MVKNIYERRRVSSVFIPANFAPVVTPPIAPQNSWSKRWNRLFGSNYGSKQIVLILILGFVNICFGISDSIGAPFLPSEARSRGVQEKWIGIIIGIFGLGFIIGSIVSGKIFTKFKSKNILSTSLVFSGINIILFGSLQWLKDNNFFKLIAVSLNVVIGVGTGCFFTACLSVIFLEFPESLSKVYATIEMCHAIGLIMGPVVGGVLFQLGGMFGTAFSFPYFVLGTFILVFAVSGHTLVKLEKKQSETTEKYSYFKLLNNFGITLNVIIYFNAGALLSFNNATLDLHLTNISDLNSTLKGLVIFTTGITYAILNQFWGNLTSKKPDSCYKISLIGCCASLLCFTIIGPLPFMPFKPQIWVVVISQVLLGIGISAVLVACFVQGFNEVIELGLADNPSITALLSSLFTISESLGYITSPIIGGYVLENYGYRWATVPMFFFQLILIVLILIFGIYPGYLKRYGNQIGWSWLNKVV